MWACVHMDAGIKGKCFLLPTLVYLICPIIFFVPTVLLSVSSLIFFSKWNGIIFFRIGMPSFSHIIKKINVLLKIQIDYFHK